MRESEIQAEILSWLKARGIWHRRIPLGGVAHGGLRKKSPLVGMPDIMIIIRGQAIFIEVKDAKGKLSEIQRQTIAELERHGALVIIARSLDDIQSHHRLLAI
jgi:hypothetical protein